MRDCPRRNGQYREALDDLTNAIGLRRDTAKVYYCRGSVYLATAKERPAAIRLQPRLDLKEMAARGLPEGKPPVAPPPGAPVERATKLALDDFNTALRIRPQYADALLGRGIAKLLLGQFEEADGDFSAAIDLDGKLAGAHCERALARFSLNRLYDAIRDADEAVRQNRDDASAYSVRAPARARTGDLYGALSDYDEAIWRKSRDPNLHYNRGLIFFSKEDYDRAIDDFDEVTRLAREDAGGFLLLAKAQMRKMGRSFDPLRYGTARPPKDHLWVEQVSRAIENLDKAIRLDGQNADSFYYRALAKLEQAQLKLAIEDLDRAIELRPKEGKYYFERGGARLASLAGLASLITPDFSGAVDDFEQARRLGLDANHAPYCYFYLGVAYERMGQKERSEHYFQLARDAGLNRKPQRTFVK